MDKIQSAEGEIDPLPILCCPGVMSAANQNLDTISTELLAALDATLNDCISARETESNELKALIE